MKYAICTIVVSCGALAIGSMHGSGATAQDIERPRPEEWNSLIHGGRFMDLFLPSPVRDELTSDTWYVAPSLLGPWTTSEFKFDLRGRRIIEGLSNMSFAKREDGSIIAVCRGGGIWGNKTGLGTWEQVTNRRAYLDVAGAFEDPVIWKTDVQYHMIVNDWHGRIAWLSAFERWV